MRFRTAGFLVFMTAVAAPSVARPRAAQPGGGTVAHDFHVTYGRMGVEGSVIQVRLRFFQDDLAEALRRFSGNQDVRLAVDPATDSLVVAYLADRFVVQVGADTLAGEIVTSGEEVDGRERIWWYVVQYLADRPIEGVRVDGRVLIELFDDQRNILRIQHFPSEHERTYYLSGGSTVAEFEV